MNNKQVNFSDKLIRGRIAEIVFEQMFRNTGHFTVLRFGYEHILPELTHERNYKKNDALETLKTAPDFVVINKHTKQVDLIEVKYQRVLSQKYTLEQAARMQESWNPSFLFIATLDGFFFDKTSDIVLNQGKIATFSNPHVSVEMQNEYLALLRKYEPKH
jgi:hypothetical protein